MIDTQPQSVLERCMERVESAPHVGAAVARRLTLTLDNGVLVVEGELDDIATKTRVVELLRAQPGFRRLLDRTRIRPAVAMPDGELRDRLTSTLLGEQAFETCRIVIDEGGVERCIHDPLEPRGSIVATIAGGVVTLEGNIPSLAHARLAGVLAWWVPGTRAVRNELLIREQDNDSEMIDGVRTALEKEPLVDADQLEVAARGGRVLLFGTLPSEEQRAIAERDAWYVLGVTEVDNRIQVAHP